jgi:hypothetical protein
VHASWSQFSAPFAFVAIVEAFVTSIEAVVAVAGPYPDASVSNVNALRKRCGRNGKECRDSYRKEVRISTSITSLRLNFPQTVFVPLITELLSLAQAGTQRQR